MGDHSVLKIKSREKWKKERKNGWADVNTKIATMVTCTQVFFMSNMSETFYFFELYFKLDLFFVVEIPLQQEESKKRILKT
jgi:hypothetical protein